VTLFWNVEGVSLFCVGTQFSFFAVVAVADKDEQKQGTSAKRLYAV
jgi:hypothetical protein